MLFLSIKIKKVGGTKVEIFLPPEKLNCGTCCHCTSAGLKHSQGPKTTTTSMNGRKIHQEAMSSHTVLGKSLSCEAGQTLEQAVQRGYDVPSVQAGTAALA